LAEWLKEATQAMVSVVVSIQMRKIFVQVRKVFSNARGSEQGVREGRRIGLWGFISIGRASPDSNEQF
jgi:hypothetical protein